MCYGQNHKSFWYSVLKYKGWLVTDTIKIQQKNLGYLKRCLQEEATLQRAVLICFSLALYLKQYWKVKFKEKTGKSW